MSGIPEFTRIYLALFFSLVAAFYTLRILFLQKSTSTKRVFSGRCFQTTWWNHLTFRVFRAAIWAVCVIRAIAPGFDRYLGVFDTLMQPSVLLAGVVLQTSAFAATIALHYQMGAEWRSGIDPKGPKAIITTGMYRFTRNPMFCCVAAAQLGFFLALPSFFSLLCLLVGLLALNSQAKVEEAHLLSLFPKDYARYASRVRRWV